MRSFSSAAVLGAVADATQLVGSMPTATHRFERHAHARQGAEGGAVGLGASIHIVKRPTAQATKRRSHPRWCNHENEKTFPVFSPAGPKQCDPRERQLRAASAMAGEHKPPSWREAAQPPDPRRPTGVPDAAPATCPRRCRRVSERPRSLGSSTPSAHGRVSSTPLNEAQFQFALCSACTQSPIVCIELTVPAPMSLQNSPGETGDKLPEGSKAKRRVRRLASASSAQQVPRWPPARPPLDVASWLPQRRGEFIYQGDARGAWVQTIFFCWSPVHCCGKHQNFFECIRHAFSCLMHAEHV